MKIAEKLLFIVPDDMEVALAALSVIRSYESYRQKNAKARMDDLDLQISIQIPVSQLGWEQWFAQYHLCTWWSGSYDLIFIFDREKAYELSKANQRPMAQTFAMQIGCDAPVLPDMSMYPEHLTMGVLMRAAILGQDFLRNDKVVVARRSGGSYLACALGLPVVEIYPTDRHRNWLSKWSHPKNLYAMIYHDNPPQEIIDRAVEDIWERSQRRLAG